MSCLTWAAGRGHTDVVRELIDHDAKVTTADKVNARSTFLLIVTNIDFWAALPYYVRRCGLLLQTKQRGLSVSLSVVIVSPAEMAEPI